MINILFLVRKFQQSLNSSKFTIKHRNVVTFDSNMIWCSFKLYFLHSKIYFLVKSPNYTCEQLKFSSFSKQVMCTYRIMGQHLYPTYNWCEQVHFLPTTHIHCQVQKSLTTYNTTHKFIQQDIVSKIDNNYRINSCCINSYKLSNITYGILCANALTLLS